MTRSLYQNTTFASFPHFSRFFLKLKLSSRGLTMVRQGAGIVYNWAGRETATDCGRPVVRPSLSAPDSDLKARRLWGRRRCHYCTATALSRTICCANVLIPLGQSPKSAAEHSPKNAVSPSKHSNSYLGPIKEDGDIDIYFIIYLNNVYRSISWGQETTWGRIGGGGWDEESSDGNALL